MFKKILWTEQNKSVKILITCISRVSTIGFQDHFDMDDPATKLLLKDIEEVNFRVNDEVVVDDEQYSRDAFSDLEVLSMTPSINVNDNKLSKKLST